LLDKLSIYFHLFNFKGEAVSESGKFLQVSIWREQDGDGHFETFEVPRQDNQNIS